MKFAEIVWIWPQMLWLLCLLPMMVAIYVRRRRKIAATSSSIPWLVAVGKVQQASYGSAVLLLLS
jgi:hypothetical protein